MRSAVKRPAGVGRRARDNHLMLPARERRSGRSLRLQDGRSAPAPTPLRLPAGRPEPGATRQVAPNRSGFRPAARHPVPPIRCSVADRRARQTVARINVRGHLMLSCDVKGPQALITREEPAVPALGAPARPGEPARPLRAPLRPRPPGAVINVPGLFVLSGDVKRPQALITREEPAVPARGAPARPGEPGRPLRAPTSESTLLRARCEWPWKSPHWWPGRGPQWWPSESPHPLLVVSIRSFGPGR